MGRGGGTQGKYHIANLLLRVFIISIVAVRLWNQVSDAQGIPSSLSSVSAELPSSSSSALYFSGVGVSRHVILSLTSLFIGAIGTPFSSEQSITMRHLLPILSFSFFQPLRSFKFNQHDYNIPPS